MTHPNRVLTLAAAVALCAPALRAQQPVATGTITGRVLEQGTNAPLAAVQVFVAGTTRGATTNETGTYRILGVTPGNVQVRVRRLGYESTVQTVAVAAGQTATLDFTIGRAAAATLEQVVVLATGEESRRREQGNSVATVDSLSTERLAAVQTFSQALAGQAAGVQILQSGGTTGSGARVRIRGANSISLSNEPLLIIDGVRVNSNANSNSIAVGGQTPSRLNDINPDDIDRIEVLKGPAAAGLFGTQAANGVIQVFTKRGSAGKPRWTVFGDLGSIKENNDYAPNYGGYFTRNGTVTRGCNLLSVSSGSCTQDSIVTFNPLQDPETTPFRTGQRQQLGVNVSGGSDRSTYYLSADNEREDGIYRTNSAERSNFRANVSAFFHEKLDAQVSVGYLDGNLKLPENDNNFLGYISNGLAGFPQRSRGDQGYDPIGPSQIDAIRNTQDIDRFTGSVQGNWRPLGWLRFNSTTGLDVLSRADGKLFPVGGVTLDADYENGQRYANRFRLGTYTANLTGTAQFNLLETLSSTTSASFQYQRDISEGTFASGFALTAGSETLGGASTRFAVDESYLDNRLAGGLLQQQFGWRDRLFLTGGIRGDDNSAFGENFSTAYYPSAQLSWVVSEESFFPTSRALGSLQLRASYGQSGLRPGNRDALVFFNAAPVRLDSAEASGVTLGGIGDPNLKPERTTEYEVGFVASGFSNRVTLDATYYAKQSKDALISRRTAPSAGVATSVFANIGAVQNRGYELLLSTRPVDRPNFAWNVTLNYSQNADKLLDLGQDVSGQDIPPIITGLSSSQRFVEGYPLGGYWGTRITSFADEDGDGIVDDITYGDSAEFLGRSTPSRLFSLNTDASFGGIFRVSALLDYRGGHRLYNGSEDFRCGIVRCRGLYDPTAPLDEQARGFATARDGVISGYFEKADFLKLREVALTIAVPERYATRLRARGLSVTLAGQNLGTWTEYSGQDPEVNYAGQSNFLAADFLSQPQVRRFNARVNLAF